MNLVLKYLFLLVFAFFIYLVFPSLPQVFAQQPATGCFTTQLGTPNGTPIQPPGCNNGGDASQEALAALKLAQQQLGKSYVYGAPVPRDWSKWQPPNVPAHFDCSGLTGWAWYWATNGKINFPGYTVAMWDDNVLHLTKYNPDTTYKQLKPGDLLFFGKPSHHTAMYEGSMGVTCKDADCFIEAPHTGANVRESHLTGYPDWVGYIRPM